MRIQTQEYNEVIVVELHGELEGDYSEVFKQTITDAVAICKSGIVIDMSRVTFIDSIGLGQLLWARDYCNENGCQLRLAGLDENCEKILEITALAGVFDRYTELAEAVKSFV